MLEALLLLRSPGLGAGWVPNLPRRAFKES
jgi:hypothetical protein